MGTEDAAAMPGQDAAVLRQLAHAVAAHLHSGAFHGPPFEPSFLDTVSASLLASCGPEAPQPSRHASMSQRTLRKVHEFIHARLTQDFCIDDIAQAACMSPYHLGRIYHETTGQSLWQYVLRCRAHLACRLIAARPGTALADIAVLCGFESYSQFIAAFRKTHGLTPGAYRRALH